MSSLDINFSRREEGGGRGEGGGGGATKMKVGKKTGMM